MMEANNNQDTKDQAQPIEFNWYLLTVVKFVVENLIIYCIYGKVYSYIVSFHRFIY